MEPKNILVVDDEPKTEIMFKEKFRKKQSFKFLFANNGEEALNVLKKNLNISLVLSDLVMPNMDGMTLLKELWGFDGHIIIISAYSNRQRNAIDAGAFDFLPKPIVWEDLENVMRRAFKLQNQVKRLETQNRQLAEENRQLQERIAELKQQLATGNTL